MTEARTLEQVQENPMHPDIAARSVCLNFKIGKLRGRRRVPTAMIQVAAELMGANDKQPDKDLLHVSKSVLECDTLKEIASMDGDMAQYIRARCLPSMLRAGIYILPVVLLEEVDAKIELYKRERQLLIDHFVDNQYEKIKKQDATRLGPLYDERDYPPVGEVKRRFYVENRMFSFDVPKALKTLKSDLWKREFVKSQEFWKQNTEAISALLRDEFAKLVKHLAATLEPGEDGKKKRFYASTISNLTDWLDLLKARNLADDADIAGLAEQAKKLLDGVAVDDIKDDEATRENIRKEFAGITARAEQLATERPVRAIDLDD